MEEYILVRARDAVRASTFGNGQGGGHSNGTNTARPTRNSKTPNLCAGCVALACVRLLGWAAAASRAALARRPVTEAARRRRTEASGSSLDKATRPARLREMATDGGESSAAAPGGSQI